MKFLCLQLARLGDIYQTRPILNALARKYPKAEIHFLVRSRFQEAAVDLDSRIRVITFDTRHILEPFSKESDGLSHSMERMLECLTKLKGENYTNIINLSFSPFSSFLTEIIKGPSASLRGYGRHSDGYFNIPDDPSSYFFAQVGVGRPNRIHLTDLFALIAEIELEPHDFRINIEQSSGVTETHFVVRDSPPYLAFHIGASSKNKTCTVTEWSQIIDSVLDVFPGNIVLVGAAAEWPADIFQVHSNRILNLCGKTTLSGLPSIVANSIAVVGGDSMVMHLASLTGTPCFNISYPSVNFWETGPRAAKSRVYRLTNEKVSPRRVSDEIIKFILGEKSSSQIYEVQSQSGVLYGHTDMDEQNMWAGDKIVEDKEFAWNLLRAIYMNGDFPKTESRNICLGFQKIQETTLLILDQMKLLRIEEKKALASQLIDQSDQIIDKIGHITPEISPLIRWFQAEKIRIPPGDLESVLKQSEELYLKLGEICSLYSINQKFEENFQRGDLTWKP